MHTLLEDYGRKADLHGKVKECEISHFLLFQEIEFFHETGFMLVSMVLPHHGTVCFV